MALVFHPPAIHRSAENLQAEVIRPGDLTKEELVAWADMRRADPDFKSPLLSPEFALAVGRSRDDTRVAVFRKHERVVGFLPFHARPDGRARPLGAPFSDLHALVTTPDAKLEPVAALNWAHFAASVRARIHYMAELGYLSRGDAPRADLMWSPGESPSGA